MLSKSAARAFFIGSTVASALVFIGLTVDTFAKIPEETRGDAITPEVSRGKARWQSSNCTGCHTLFGEGAYYAPDLTKVIERRGPGFVRAMLREPDKMYPGQRRMQNYHFSTEQIEDLVSFLTWAGQVDLQGFPPRPTLMPIAVPARSASAGVARTDGRPLIFNQLCIACHSLGGQGGDVGPALDFVGDRCDEEYIGRWLHDPGAVRAGSKMPKLPRTDAQIDELGAFLSQLKKESRP
jgi:nitric oxide reductase subunit C